MKTATFRWLPVIGLFCLGVIYHIYVTHHPSYIYETYHPSASEQVTRNNRQIEGDALSGNVQNDTSVVSRWDDILQALLMDSYAPSNCSQLFSNVSEQELYTKDVQDKRRQFYQYLKDLPEKYFEGNTGTLKEQSIMYFLLANWTSVGTVCEIGFNAGHSTLLWLTANSKSKVYSFDLGVHSYTKRMVKYLQRNFPERLTVTFGDSRKTVPRFAAQHPGVQCDIAVVDGGHTYDIAKSDLRSMRQISHPGSLVLLDDTKLGKKSGKAVMDAWQTIAHRNIATKLFHCVYPRSGARGFLIGKYI